ncbi:protein disulfide-isomerase A3 [Leptinotarsa decemlineata]|uniref:protein disulfide-isomerase A3 n=1 Tax=Leptinotarsa decemlineata TaxID=7539 RepID=UPI003D308394
MKLPDILVVCLLFLLYEIAPEEYDVTENNFDSWMKEQRIVFVMFFISWSEEYKLMYAEYQKSSAILDRNNSILTLLKVNCSAPECEETCLRFRVNENTILKVFRYGEYSETYRGRATALDIAKFIQSHLNPASTELETTNDLNDFLYAENKTAVVGMFNGESALKLAFLNVADRYRNKVRYAHTKSADIRKVLEVNNDILMFRPLYLHNKYEPSILQYTGEADPTTIKQFIKEYPHGLVGRRTQDNVEDFEYPLVVVYFDIDFETFPQTTQYWRNRILKVADMFRENVTFAMSNAEDFQEELADLDYLDKPVVIAKDGTTNKYVLVGEFSSYNFENFVGDFLGNSLKPFFSKTEPIPAFNNESVKIAVAQNFKSLVVDSEKDTIISFHSKWCTLCKKLASLYVSLAKSFSSENIVFVAMDAYKNDVPEEYKVEELYTPTMYWAPIGSKQKPFRYRGKLEEKDLIRFIAKYATYELKGYDREGKPKKVVRTEL